LPDAIVQLLQLGTLDLQRRVVGLDLRRHGGVADSALRTRTSFGHQGRGLTTERAAGTILACSDDSCGGPLQTTVLFQAVLGNTYLFAWAPSTRQPRTGTITVQIPAPDHREDGRQPANGHTYHQLPGSSWTVAEANAVLLGGHLVTGRRQAEHDWIVANFHNYLGTTSTCGRASRRGRRGQLRVVSAGKP
jgi:hypothetical protein